MKQLNVKKLVLLNLPYLLLGLFATNLGEAWRLAVGADASAKLLSFFSTLPVALGSWWPSLHPLDLAVGLCCGAGLRLAVYLKGKNAKKYRHNVEYGSARWGTHDDIAPYRCQSIFKWISTQKKSIFLVKKIMITIYFAKELSLYCLIYSVMSTLLRLITTD